MSQILNPGSGDSPHEKVAASRRKIRIPLSRFTEGETVRLQGTEGELRLTVPLNPRMRVSSLAVGLAYVPSISLDESGSHVSVDWNGQALSGRMEPGPGGNGPNWFTGVVERDAVFSPENEMRIHAVHNGVGGSKGTGTPPSALWTEIDLEVSWIELGYGRAMPALEPREFARLIDCRPWLESRIAVVTPPLEDGNDDYFQWGGWVAQWIGRFSGAQMPEMAHRTSISEADADAVVIGTRGDLTQMLSSEGLELAGEGDVSLFPHPENHGHLLLLLTGANREAVGATVRRFVETQEALWSKGESEFLSSASPFARVRKSPDAKTGEAPWLTFHAAARDSDTVASVWMVAGKFARFTGAPSGKVEFSGLPPSGKGDWIMAGPIAGIDGNILSAAPVALHRGAPLPALLVPAFEKGSGKEEIDDRIGGAPGPRNDEGLLMQFESPFARGYTATLITADDSSSLYRAVKTLIEPAVWNRISGDTVSWSGVRKDSLECRVFSGTRTGREAVRGEGGAKFFLWNPWIAGGLGLSVLATLAMRLRKSATGRRRRGWDPGEETSF